VGGVEEIVIGAAEGEAEAMRRKERIPGVMRDRWSRACATSMIYVIPSNQRNDIWVECFGGRF
jgi:hypothetical protein